MNVLVAPAAFKESFGPRAVAEAVAGGVLRALPGARVLQCPVSDGGDGLLDAVLAAQAVRERVRVTGPLGEAVWAEVGWLDAETAILECSSACGLALVGAAARDPLRATTRGVGELLAEAVARGARTAIVGLGGSATVDGGVGAARALGWSFFDAHDASLPEGGGALEELVRCEPGWSLGAKVVALADVSSPLIGPEGAAPVFGPQKGASPQAVARLTRGLERLAELFAELGRGDLAALPGGGAAGGLGAGLVFFVRAQLVPGAAWVLERVGFDAALASADLVITAEGRFDRTSLAGKAAGEVVRRAQQAKKKVAVVAGAAADLIGVHVAAGSGARLDAGGIAALAERVTREAFGLPAS